MLQQAVRERVSSGAIGLERMIAVPVDVGKFSAAAMVVDFTGRRVVHPFEFALRRDGLAVFVRRVGDALPDDVELVRVGVEAAGHYHLPVTAAGVLPAAWEVRVLNPAQVAAQRRVRGQRSVKTDRIDLVAIADLLAAGQGHPVPAPADPVVALGGWVAHRRRRVLSRRQTIQQLTTQVDRCFPGLGACLSSVALTQAGRLVISEFADPARLARLGPQRLRDFGARRGVRITTPLAERLVDAARQALPTIDAHVARHVLAADLELLDDLETQIAAADDAIAEILPSTPFAVLTSVPGWGVQRSAAYGGAVGDPGRWPSHRHLYRASGLTPSVYESAGKRHDGRISREGSVSLRCALVNLGMGLWQNEPHARSYAQALRARGKPGGIIATALAHRANRISFAMVRSQQPWNPDRWD